MTDDITGRPVDMDRARFLKELRRGLRSEGVVPPRRKAIAEEVEARLDEAAADAGEAEAVRSMGDPAEVAREYAAVEREHPVSVPRWGRGLAWAIGILAVLLVLQVFRVPTFGLVRWMDRRSEAASGRSTCGRCSGSTETRTPAM